MWTMINITFVFLCFCPLGLAIKLNFDISKEAFLHLGIVNRGEWLWNSTKFFILCFCSLFWPWPCTKHNSCLLLTEELTNRNVLVTLLIHSVWTQNKRLCTVVDLPTWILASLFALLMFAGLHNHSPLLTMIWVNKVRFKRRTSHVPNLMQMGKIYCFLSFALDSAHVKFDVWSGP